jgi:DNA-3-methyladenine glycosylase I
MTDPADTSTASADAIDDRPRCWWATGESGPADPLMVAYHDTDWGITTHDDVELFERLALESFQAGLSWSTILRKREAFRAAFRGFDPAVVAAFGARDRARLLADAGIVRNRSKIDATIGNAAAVRAIQAAFGSFDAYLADRLPGPIPRLPATARPGDIPATTPAAEALAADLRRHGLRFVGPTIVYAFMQSVGLVDDHLPGCFRYVGRH